MKTYLFDFDGTLVDSMPSYCSAMLQILDENGIEYGPDLIKIITPLGMNGTAEYYLRLGVPLSKENIMRRMGELILDTCLKRLGIFDIFDNVWSCDQYLGEIIA